MSEHLTAAEIEGYRLGNLAPNARLAIDDHLAVCDTCRELVASIAPAPEPEPVAPPPPAPAAGPDWRTQFWTPMLAAVGICLLALGWRFYAVAHRAPPPATRRSAVTPVSATTQPDYSHWRDDALRTGAVPIPADILALRAKPDTPVSPTAIEQQELEAPVGTATLTARPEFSWRAIRGAQQYRVVIFADETGAPVMDSGDVPTLLWTPAQDLDSGKTYFWELSTHIGSTLVKAPQPPVPPARFRVLDAAERERLADVAARYPQDHILLGVIDARAGAIESARREWATAIASGQQEAERLLASVASR